MAMSINWYSAGATAFVLLIAFALVGAMFLFIKLTTDDSDRFKELKEMVETIFGTPAHLRPSPPQDDNAAAGAQAGAAQSAAAVEPFTDACPACGEAVNEQHASCPSCGLRIL